GQADRDRRRRGPPPPPEARGPRARRRVDATQQSVADVRRRNRRRRLGGEGGERIGRRQDDGLTLRAAVAQVRFEAHEIVAVERAYHVHRRQRLEGFVVHWVPPSTSRSRSRPRRIRVFT